MDGYGGGRVMDRLVLFDMLPRLAGANLSNSTFSYAKLFGECGPSMMFVCSLKLKSSSTVDASIVGLLGFDIHYQKGPVGTDGEYS